MESFWELELLRELFFIELIYKMFHFAIRTKKNIFSNVHSISFTYSISTRNCEILIYDLSYKLLALINHVS